MYRLKDILYESASKNFWVLDVGDKGFAVMRVGATASSQVAAIGRSLGLQRAIDEANRRDDALFGSKS